MQEGVNELLKLANKTLPGAWDAVLAQAYIYGILYMIGAVTLGIVASVLFLKLKPMSEEDYDKPDSYGKAMIISMFIAILLAAIFLVVGTLYLINPEYYAIQLLRS